MKNIHILPTDKPTGIFKSGDNLLFSIMNKVRTTHEGFHIYITSDEEIKEEDWLIWNDKVYKDSKRSFTGVDYSQCKKIILTTDQDLIKDGVQKIDDEFLQWFVKNPSCEEVEIRKEMYIPQSNGKISDGKITHEISLDSSQNTLPYYKLIIPKESKQKTLEKLAKEYYPDELKMMEMMERIAFKRGYTECEERMYSEEDMRKAFKDGSWVTSWSDMGIEMKYDTFEQWFEQFKKK